MVPYHTLPVIIGIAVSAEMQAGIVGTYIGTEDASAALSGM